MYDVQYFQYHFEQYYNLIISLYPGSTARDRMLWLKLAIQFGDQFSRYVVKLQVKNETLLLF